MLEDSAPDMLPCSSLPWIYFPGDAASCASLRKLRSARDKDSYIKLILKVTKVHLNQGAFRILQ